MNHALFEKHEKTLAHALDAIRTRGYWSPFNEMPSPRTYGETAAADGEAAFKAQLGQPLRSIKPAATALSARSIRHSASR